MSRVLVIEDNSADIDLLKRAFAAHRITHQVTTLEDGEQAIRFLDGIQSKSDFDLIIIDLNIPKHDGIEVLKRYRLHPLLKDVPVAVFTSSDSPAEKNRAMTLGVSAYLRKPMELDEYMQIGATFRQMLAP